jgi:hypothetical protein
MALGRKCTRIGADAAAAEIVHTVFVVLGKRSDGKIRPMAPFALIDLRKTTVELWMLLLLLLLISVAWLKSWD